MFTQIAKFMGPTWGPLCPVRTRWAPCWPREPCYQGSFLGTWHWSDLTHMIHLDIVPLLALLTLSKSYNFGYTVFVILDAIVKQLHWNIKAFSMALWVITCIARRRLSKIFRGILIKEQWKKEAITSSKRSNFDKSSSQEIYSRMPLYRGLL